MCHSKMIAHDAACVAVLVAGAALAKDPVQTPERGLSTPAGCMDSVRGRTHILRFCGDEHYWIKRPMAASPWPLNAPMAWFADGGGTTPVSVNPNR